MKLYKIFIYTVLVLLALSVVIPVIWVLMASLKENGEFYGDPFALPNGFYFQNFIDAWNSANMGKYFMNSVYVTLTSIAILLLLAIPCAYALSRYLFPLRSIVRALFMGGLFINVSYIVVPIFLMLIGINKALDVTFFINNRFILSLVYASTALPFTVYLLQSYFSTLPRAYEEASAIDGASPLITMLYVMLPMARPAVITVILFNFLAFWNEYIIALTLMTNDSFKTLPVGLMNLMKAQNAAAQYGKMYAGLVIVMIPTLILYICVQKKLTHSLAIGGVKG